jgi:hypothetical protein
MTANGTVELPPAGKCCKLCGRHRPFAEYVWRDAAGREGVTARCVACRNRGKRDAPGIPKLRYPATRHAVKRYIERCAPRIAEQAESHSRACMAARLEMRHLMATAERAYEWPDWLSDRAPHGAAPEDAPGHLRISDDTVFVLARSRKAGLGGNEVIVTVLTRDGASED